MSTSSVQGSPNGTNQDKADGSVHHETSPTLKEHTQNVDKDTKLVRSNAVSGTLTVVTKMNARYEGSISCITFTALVSTQEISIWEKWNCEQLLNHKMCIVPGTVCFEDLRLMLWSSHHIVSYGCPFSYFPFFLYNVSNRSSTLFKSVLLCDYLKTPTSVTYMTVMPSLWMKSLAKLKNNNKVQNSPVTSC